MILLIELASSLAASTRESCEYTIQVIQLQILVVNSNGINKIIITVPGQLLAVQLFSYSTPEVRQQSGSRPIYNRPAIGFDT